MSRQNNTYFCRSTFFYNYRLAHSLEIYGSDRGDGSLQWVIPACKDLEFEQHPYQVLGLGPHLLSFRRTTDSGTTQPWGSKTNNSAPGLVSSRGSREIWDSELQSHETRTNNSAPGLASFSLSREIWHSKLQSHNNSAPGLVNLNLSREIWDSKLQSHESETRAWKDSVRRGRWKRLACLT